MNKNLQEKLKEIEKIAKEELNLDYYPVQWEVVGQEVLLEVMSYGLPSRSRHWSYGQSYEYQKMQGEMGHSKVYELVLNNNPSYAFLLDTNPDIANIMVMAHVLGHSACFKHNYLFKQTDNKMVYHAAERARRIDDYIEQHGLKAVEHIMDVAFSMDKNIDWHRGALRKPYGGELPKKSYKAKAGHKDEFIDILGTPTVKKKKKAPSFPPHPEYDLLWFLIQHANLEDWERDIFEIIREESYYFYPQYVTQRLNEGIASWVHAEIMYRMKSITEAEYLEFVKIHERVVQPGGNKLKINPYFLGFTLLNDIKKRWDKKFEDGDSDINGLEKIYEVVANEDDVSFVRTYLTKEISEDLKLFCYKYIKDQKAGKIIKNESTDLDDVVENLISDCYGYRAPELCIVKASHEGLELEHTSGDIGTLDPKHLEKVMGYLFEVWGAPINVQTIDDEGEEMHYTRDELGFSG
jgi:stage V sporulation protein R